MSDDETTSSFVCIHVPETHLGRSQASYVFPVLYLAVVKGIHAFPIVLEVAFNGNTFSNRERIINTCSSDFAP